VRRGGHDLADAHLARRPVLVEARLDRVQRIAVVADDRLQGLRAGAIRSGDVFTLESWQNATALLEVKGANLRPSLVRSATIDPDRIYRVATIDYVADEEADQQIGKPESRQDGIMLRDATIAYLKKRGFS